jgi:hypothetical protein
MSEQGYYVEVSPLEGFSIANRHTIRLRCTLAGEEAVMVHADTAIAILLMLVALIWAFLDFRYTRRGPVISTTEWVKLMRANDVQFAQAARARAAKRRPSQVR